MKAKYICPILTSVNADGSVNYADMHAAYDRILGAGIDGILTGGSAGEFYAFTYEEVKALIKDAIAHIDHKALVIAGTGRMAKSETIQLSNEMLAAGADAVMVVGPYYCGCTQENVFDYYDEILSNINGKMYLYNFPDRTGYDVSAETILRLRRKHDNIVGLKDTNALLRHTQKYIQTLKGEYPNFEIYTGYDNNCIPSVISGGDGCIGALSNVYPALCHSIIMALSEEKIDSLKELQRSIDQKFLFYEAYPVFLPLMKWALVELGHPFQEHCKAPLQPLTGAEKESLAQVAETLWRNI